MKLIICAARRNIPQYM